MHIKYKELSSPPEISNICGDFSQLRKRDQGTFGLIYIPENLGWDILFRFISTGRKKKKKKETLSAQKDFSGLMD
jgi:hypothetical protein